MKESTAEARKRQIYGLRKRRRRKKRLKICACILMLLFLGVGVVRSAMSLIGIWENGQNEMIEQTCRGNGKRGYEIHYKGDPDGGTRKPS